MKTFLTFSLLLVFGIIRGYAADLEYRVFRISGEPISQKEIVALIEGGFSVPIISGSTTITANGSFVDDHTSESLYPTSFNSVGYPTTLDAANLGHMFTGSTTRHGDLYEYKFTFSYNRYLGTTIYKDKSGNVIPIPRVEASTMNSSAAAAENQWTIFGGLRKPTSVDSSQMESEILAIRIKKE